MPLVERKSAPIDDRDAAEVGLVEVCEGGVTYRGDYRVLASGRGRQRYSVTPDKRVIVSYQNRLNGTCIGVTGLEAIASTLLRELVAGSME